MWEPPIDRQLTDFTQTKTVVTTRSRTVIIYEERASTGERREVDSYIETETSKDVQTRNVAVNITPWVDYGLLYGCSNWAPAPSTVSNGEAFTQTATDCSQEQRSSVSYVDRDTRVSLGGWWTRSRTLANQDNARTSYGTKEPLYVCAPGDVELASTLFIYGFSQPGQWTIFWPLSGNYNVGTSLPTRSKPWKSSWGESFYAGPKRTGFDNQHLTCQVK